MTDAAAAERAAARVWYAVEGRSDTAVAIIAALEASGRSSTALARRMRSTSGLGDTDVTAVLFLLTEAVEQRIVTPKDLAAHLQMSTAAASGLVDRLERSGYVTREAHPSDRRGVTVVLTEGGRQRADATIGAVYTRLLDLTESLLPEEAATVLGFLRSMTAPGDRLLV